MADENTQRRRTLILRKIDRQWNEKKADNGAVCVAIFSGCITGGPSSQCYPFVFPFYANVQANVTYGMYYYITTKFDHAKHDSRLAAYGGVVLQRFEFIKVCKADSSALHLRTKSVKLN